MLEEVTSAMGEEEEEEIEIGSSMSMGCGGLFWFGCNCVEVVVVVWGGRRGGDMDWVRSILFGCVGLEVLAVGGEGGGGDSVRSMWCGLGFGLFEGGSLEIVGAVLGSSMSVGSGRT